MVDRPFLNSQKWQSQQWRANREGAHPKILLFEKKFIKACANMGIPIFANSVVRTEAEQTELFIKGVSKARAGESPHNFGCAEDLIHSTRGWRLFKIEWLLLRHIAMEVASRNGIKMRWGGDWDNDGVPVLDDPDESFWDAAHWELENWKEEKEHFPW